MRCPRCGKMMMVDVTPSDAGPKHDLFSWYCDSEYHEDTIWIDRNDCGDYVEYSWREKRI